MLARTTLWPAGCGFWLVGNRSGPKVKQQRARTALERLVSGKGVFAAGKRVDLPMDGNASFVWSEMTGRGGSAWKTCMAGHKYACASRGCPPVQPGKLQLPFYMGRFKVENISSGAPSGTEPVDGPGMAVLLLSW